jgi:predicted aconitase
MAVKLSKTDEQMLDGREGGGVQTAMRILVKMAEILDAEQMISISSAHIDACGLLSDAGIEFAEMLVGKGAKVSVPTTLNMGPLDLQNWQEFEIDEEFAEKAIRQSKAYTDMGCRPTWTCAPYQGDNVAGFGEQIAWGESNAVCYANSVLGARTNRYADYMDICAAITGRVPEYGLHIEENRKGQVLVHLDDINPEVKGTQTFFVTLGHLLGTIAGEEIPVIEGIEAEPTSDQYKALCAAAASSGAVALIHIVGITPEAQTLEKAFGNKEPLRRINIGAKELSDAYADLSTTDRDGDLDAVIVGCPHYSIEEFGRLAELIQLQIDKGKTLNPNVRFVVITNRLSYSRLQKSGHLEVLREFGIEITLDTCPFHTPMVRAETKVIMTDSGKCAYYAPGELDVRVVFGDISDCVESAVIGRICREEIRWDKN